MSKHIGKKVREDKARRRLVKAQLELHTAQEKRARAITQAEHEIERTKQRSNKWVAKATERVERRAGAMARAEARLLATTAPRHPARPPAAQPEAARPTDNASAASTKLTVSSPAAAANLLERKEAEVAAQRDSSPIVVPESVEIEAPNASNGSEASEENNLHPW
jgi:tRNA U34 5-carboxymethylaminomethyl modifying enzyme MnmG/GidA